MAYNLSNDGWLRLWRKLLTKRIWTETDPKEKTIMVTLLLMVNFKSKEATWKEKDITLKPGSMIATIEDIAYISNDGITIDDVSDAIIRFEGSLEFLKQKISSDDPCKHLITILNWRQYQQDGLSNEQSEQRKNDAKKLYDFYVEKIMPANKSKARAISNILKHSKKYTFKDMAKSVINYIPKAMKYGSEHRKDPANFFGIHEPYFKDFLPGVFNPKESVAYQDSVMQAIPEVLTPDRLRELNA